MRKGQLIVFEGLDCSFKETNSKVLLNHIEQKYGHDVKLVSFPRYQSKASYFVTEYLSGRYGVQEDLTSNAISSLYMVDMFDYMKKIGQRHLDNGGILIMDRYWFSNLYYRLGWMKENASDDEDSPFYANGIIHSELPNEISKLAYAFELPTPDMVYKMISSSNAIKDKVTAKHSQNDIHESDLKYLMYVKEEFDAFDFAHLCYPAKEVKQVNITVSFNTTAVENGYDVKERADVAKEVIDAYEEFRKGRK